MRRPLPRGAAAPASRSQTRRSDAEPRRPLGSGARRNNTLCTPLQPILDCITHQNDPDHISLSGRTEESICAPIHKAGSQSDLLSYRPISLLFSVNKIVERVLAYVIPGGKWNPARRTIRVPKGTKLRDSGTQTHKLYTGRS